MTIDLIAPPEVSYRRDYSGKVRTKRARWTGETVEGKTHIVELSVSHNSDRKQFSVYLTRFLSSSDNGFAVEEYQPFRDIVRLPSMPVARFSAKALDTAFEWAMDNRLNIMDNAEAVRILERAA